MRFDLLRSLKINFNVRINTYYPEVFHSVETHLTTSLYLFTSYISKKQKCLHLKKRTSFWRDKRRVTYNNDSNLMLF